MEKCKCEEIKTCECEVIDLGSNCVIYRGEYLPNIRVSNNTNLTEVFRVIDENVKRLSEQEVIVPSIVNAINLGSGAKVFKEIDNLKRLQFKTLVPKTSIVDITEGNNDIQIGINLAVLDSEINRNIKPLIGEGNIEVIEEDTQILLQVPQVNVISDTLSVSSTDESISINLIDSGVKKFYVDGLYQGTSSVGTEAKPFKTVQQAIDAYVGNGNYISPQYMQEKAMIVIRKGSLLLLPENMLVNGLHLYLENRAEVLTTVSNEYLFNFDTLPSSVPKFNIVIEGENENTSFFRVSRPVCMNTGYGEGSSDNSYIGRNLTFKNITINTYRNNVINKPVFASKEDYFQNNHNNLSSQFYFEDTNIQSISDNIIFKILNSRDIVYRRGSVRFNRQQDPSKITPVMIYSGRYFRFENTHLIGFNTSTRGIMYLEAKDSDSKIEFLDCLFEGDASCFFKYDTSIEMTRMTIQNAKSTFQYFGKLFDSPIKVTTVDIINSYFTSPEGDIDLTKNNTTSVINYFNGILKESLVKSPNVLTEPVGMPYIHTVDLNDKNTWKRTVVFN